MNLQVIDEVSQSALATEGLKRGAFDREGEFIADDAAELEVDWESQKPENYFYCLNCGALFRLDEDSTDPEPRFTVEP